MGKGSVKRVENHLSSLSLRQAVTPVTSCQCNFLQNRKHAPPEAPNHAIQSESDCQLHCFHISPLFPLFAAAYGAFAFSSFNVSVAIHFIVRALVTDLRLIVNKHWWNDPSTDGLLCTFTLPVVDLWIRRL